MSILIKGMDMPKENNKKLLLISADGTVDIASFLSSHVQKTDATAVEVPTPHGDLVDRDVVAEKIRQRLGIRNLDYLLETEKPIAMSIKEAPTVIEREE